MSTYPTPAELPADARNWAMAAHLSALAGLLAGGVPAFLGPLVVWLLRKDSDGFATTHALEALNFNLSVLIYGLVAGFLTIVTLGLALIVIAPVALVAFVAYLIVTVKAAVRAANGERYRYPLSIRLLR
jgi:hypothetical protein